MLEINIEENKKKIVALLDSVPQDYKGLGTITKPFPEENLISHEFKEKVEQEIIALKGYLETSDFYTAPASTQYHLHVKGGLAQHSLNVYYTLCDLCKQMGVEMPNRTKIITTVLHDVNKVDYYKDNILKSGKLSPAKPYITEDLFPVGHGEKSVIILQKYLTLTEQEILMVRWHMGMFDREFMSYEKKIKRICPNAILLITADWLASVFVDPTYEPTEEIQKETQKRDREGED